MLIGFCTMSAQCPAACTDREVIRLGVERSSMLKAVCTALNRQCPLIKLQYIDCVSEIDESEENNIKPVDFNSLYLHAQKAGLNPLTSSEYIQKSYSEHIHFINQCNAAITMQRKENKK